MPRGRHFQGRARTKKIDHTAWELSTGFTGGLAAGSVGIQFSSVGTTPATVMRMRGEVFANVDGTGAPATLVQVNYGIILVPEGTGTTVLYDPFADGNAPWLLYGQAYIGYEEIVVDVVDVPQLTMFRHVVDNKAMRIIRPDVEMQMVVTNTSINGAEGINFGYGIRWLQGF